MHTFLILVSPSLKLTVVNEGATLLQGQCRFGNMSKTRLLVKEHQTYHVPLYLLHMDGESYGVSRGISFVSD